MSKRGFALVSVIIAFVIISIMAVFFTSLVSVESNIATDKFSSTKAYYGAYAGFENAKYRLSLVYNWFMLKEGLFETRSDNLDGASFKTEIYLPGTALKNNINKNKKDITVYDTSRFPSSNILILIDDEQILCTSKTTTQFINCTRGYNGTSNQTHLAGAAVYSVAAISSVNTSARTITVNNNEKFLNSGRLLIDDDPSFSGPLEVSYTDKGNNIFYGCDDLSWYITGTNYYAISSEQIEIRVEGEHNGYRRNIQTTIYR